MLTRVRLIRAIADFDKAIELKPDYANAHNNRAFLLGMLKQSVADARDYGSGDRLMTQHDWDKMIADMTAYIEKNPQSAAAYINRGAAYHKKGAFDEAIADYTKATELQPNFAEAYNNRGACLS